MGFFGSFLMLHLNGEDRWIRRLNCVSLQWLSDAQILMSKVQIILNFLGQFGNAYLKSWSLSFLLAQEFILKKWSQKLQKI